MPRKYTYTPTETDRLTGEQVRKLRRAAGETLIETIERSGVGIGQSSLSRVELGQRQLTVPEATKLAAHWNTTADRIFTRPKPAVTEQAWLGNEEEDLFSAAQIIPIRPARNVIIDRDNPMTPEQYRAEVWVPYLEARYAADQQKTA